MNSIRPKDLIMNTPLIHGRVESIQPDGIFSPGSLGVTTP